MTMNDSELDDLLRFADRQIQLPASFRHNVWSRIELASLERSNRWTWLENAFSALARPLGAVTTVAALGILGLWLGSAGMSDRGDSKISYVESVSPFAAAHAR